MHPLDSIPARPEMPKVSRVLHNSNRYNACIVGPGLVIQNNHTGTGKLLPKNHPQYADYVDCLSSAIDTKESDFICKIFLR